MLRYKALLVRTLVIAIAVVAVGALWWWRDMQAELARPLDMGGTALVYTVAPGMGVGDIARDLAAAEVLRWPLAFVWQARLTGKARRIQAGEYRITPGMSAQELLDRFVEGRVVQYTMTFIEGWTFEQVKEALASHPKLIHTLKGIDRCLIMERLGYPGRDPEGLFFPDTYHFTIGTSDVTLLRRAYARMGEHLNKTWQGRAPGLPYRSPYDALIMASIIEKEGAHAAERPHIAGVFVRRLERGMPLQTDPSVIYGLGSGFNGDLTRRDLGFDSPYNTYRYTGLTPTPIAMPSAGAIHAAMHPAPGDALYFVAKGDGRHQFSSTLEEHTDAVVRYQLNPNQARP